MLRLSRQQEQCRRCGGHIVGIQLFRGSALCSDCEADMAAGELKSWTAWCCVLSVLAAAAISVWIIRG